MKLIKDNSGQFNPIQVLLTVMLMVITMAFLVLIFGTFTDGFIDVINGMDLPLSVWGMSMMAKLPLRYATWIYLVPVFFCLVIFVWAVKTVIRKHEYTTQQEEFISDEL